MKKLVAQLLDFLSGQNEPKDFHSVNSSVNVTRIKYVSIFLIFNYGFYLYGDFYLYKNVEDLTFRLNLIAIHLAGFVLSVLFLFLYRYLKPLGSCIHSKWVTFTIHFYLSIYILGGVLASLNSQRLTGNIDAYLIIVISVATLFSIKPLHFSLILLINHVFFLTFLPINEDANMMISKQINSTVTVLIAFLISCTFYTYRIKDYIKELKLKESENNLEKLFTVNPFPLLLCRQETGQVKMSNDAALNFFNIAQESLEQQSLTDILNISAEECLKYREKLNGSSSISNHIIELHPSRWVLLNAEVIDFENDIYHLIGFTDITELKKIENELTHNATIDPLTGVLNRKAGMDQMQKWLTRSKQENLTFTVCFIDINNLKTINDTFGHSEGDRLIQSVCEVIKQEISHEDFLFRYGGDEFILILLGKELSEAQQTWNSINRNFKRHKQNHEESYSISASHGLFHYKSGITLSIEEMIKQADSEMYKEKALVK